MHHRNIIHRDLKSANIFLSEDKKDVKLGDMNVSKILKKDFASTQTGTPYYASPEVWRDEDYNAKADIWSLGCVIFELCNLKQPFQASGLDKLYKKVQSKSIESFDGFYSKQLQEMVHMCLTLDYQKRPGAKELMHNSFFDALLTTTKSIHDKQGILEKNLKTKVKYRKEGLRINLDSETIHKANLKVYNSNTHSELSEEDPIIKLQKPKKRWGRTLKDNNSSENSAQSSIMGTIPVDMTFKDLATKLPKPRYSLSGDRSRHKKEQIMLANRRSKSGVGVIGKEKRERLKLLSERRARLVKATLKGTTTRNSRKEGGRVTSGSTKTSKSRTMTSNQSKMSKKGLLKKNRKMGIDSQQNQIKRVRKYIKQSEGIGKSLLKEKQEQQRILSRIEVCHSQLISKEKSMEKSVNQASIKNKKSRKESKKCQKDNLKDLLNQDKIIKNIATISRDGVKKAKKKKYKKRRYSFEKFKTSIKKAERERRK